MDQNIIKITPADLRKIISEEATKFRRKRMLTEQREKIAKALNECECGDKCKCKDEKNECTCSESCTCKGGEVIECNDVKK